jgi:hypothetical protein
MSLRDRNDALAGLARTANFDRSNSEDTIPESGLEIPRLGVAMRDREFLCGVLCGAVLTFAGVAIWDGQR